MTNLTLKEKQAVKFLIKKELDEFEKQKETLEEFRPEVNFLAVEEKYDELLKEILKKLE